METRTITQFHFLTWDELCNPPSTKAVLDFRRYVKLKKKKKVTMWLKKEELNNNCLILIH